MSDRLSLAALTLVLWVASAYAGVNCDGVDDVATFANQANFHCTNATCTITFWAKTNSTTGFFYSKFTADVGGYFAGSATNNRLDANIRNLGVNMASRRTLTNSVTQATWHHVAVVMTTNTTTVTSNVLLLYLDGVLNQDASMTHVGVNPNGYTTSTGAFKLCFGETTGAKDIEIDDFTIIARALTADEIRSLALSKTRYLHFQASLIAYAPMDTCREGAVLQGSTFPDHSGDDNTLTPSRGTDNLGMTCTHRGLMMPRGVE